MRPIEVGFASTLGAVVLALAVEYARTSSTRAELARTGSVVARLAKENESLRASVQGLERETREIRLSAAELAAVRRRLGELEDSLRDGRSDESVRLAAEAAVDAALRRREQAFVDDMRKRGEELLAGLAREVDMKGLEAELRRLAEGLRSNQPARPPERPATPPAQARPGAPQPVGMEAAVVKGLDGLADGLALWREFREGRISQEEFDRRRKELENRVRGEIEKTLTPEERARIEEALRGR